MEKEKFYGYHCATVPAVGEQYPGIETPRDLYDALSHVWSEQTCAPRLRPVWSPQNNTAGQCSITSFLVQDIFGGEVYGVPLEEGGYHCFNKVGDSVFDLTDAQFGGKKLDFSLRYPQSREEHLSNPDKYARYLLLKEGLAAYCKAK